MSHDCLKLNASYYPIDVISWQDAITLLWSDKAEIIENYEDRYIRTYNDAIKMPCIIRLFTFIQPKKDMRFYKPFTRRNVYDRDHGVCQYCSHAISLNSMTYDHVYPKSKGGLTIWQNIVCSCLKCNSKKNDKTLEESGMKLISKPYAPILADSYQKGMIAKLKSVPKILNNKQWLSYLYWNAPLEQDKI